MKQELAIREPKKVPGPKGHWLLGKHRRFGATGSSSFWRHRGSTAGRAVPNAAHTLYLINHPDGIQHVLQDNNHNYHKGFSVVPSVEMALGRGPGDE